MVNFPTWIPGCDSHSSALLYLFRFLILVSVLQWLSLHWKILVMLLSQFPLTPSNSKWDALFHIIAYVYSCADLDGLCDYFRDVPWKDVFKLDASAPAS